MPITITRVTATAVSLAVAATFAVSCSQTKEATKDVASSASSVASSAGSAASSVATSAAGAASSAAGSAAGAVAGKTTLFYPEEQGAMFSIEAPDDWKVDKIAQVGDFGSLESPNGSVLQFRAQNFDTETEAKKEIDDIVDSTTGFLKDNYTDVKLDDPKDVTVDGQPGAQLSGTGKDKDGNAVQFLSAVVALGPKSIAEIWGAVFPEGNNDLDTATAILDSFKVAKQ